MLQPALVAEMIVAVVVLQIVVAKEEEVEGNYRLEAGIALAQGQGHVHQTVREVHSVLGAGIVAVARAAEGGMEVVHY